jgi:diacylglycerol kinase (ATP)
VIETVAIVHPGLINATLPLPGGQRRPLGEWLDHALGPTTLRCPETAERVAGEVHAALGQGARRVVAVGGDGTLNLVLNGLFGPADPAGCGRASSSGPTPILAAPTATLAHLPLGTGNDFARSVTGDSLTPWLEPDRWVERYVDVGCAVVSDSDGGVRARYFLSVSHFGVGARIAGLVGRVPGILGSHLRYRVATVLGLLGQRNPSVSMCLDGAAPETHTVSLVAMANASHFGAGMCIAPEADITDGRLQVVRMGDIGLIAFARYGRRLDAGTHRELAFVHTRKALSIEARPGGDERIPVAVDGEPFGWLPGAWSILPGALPMLMPASLDR